MPYAILRFAKKKMGGVTACYAHNERKKEACPAAERVCPQCGETMRDMGVEVRKELKLIPAKVVVVEHTTHTYACRNCE